MNNVTLYYHGKSTTFGEPEIQLDFSSGSYDIAITARGSEIIEQIIDEEFYSYIGFNVSFHRKPSEMLGSFYGPTTLFVCLSWLSFLVPSSQVNTNPKLKQDFTCIY